VVRQQVRGGRGAAREGRQQLQAGAFCQKPGARIAPPNVAPAPLSLRRRHERSTPPKKQQQPRQPQQQGKAWPEAAEAYRHLASCALKTDAKHDAASALVEGAKCAMRAPAASADDPSKGGVAMLRQAVELYTDMGRLNMAARNLREIAEALEKQGEKREAVAFFEQAADLFATEGATSEANRCRLKIAECAALDLEDYPRAAQLFEEIARTAADNPLLKFGAKGHILCAGICAMCHLPDGELDVRLERWRDLDPQLAGSRELGLLEGCVSALRQCDDKAFAQAVAEFDSMTRLDAWKTALLLRVKRRIAARQQGEERVGGGAGGGGEGGGGGDEDDEVL
jgi:alpha-soluble NSF attachment protein